jgi:sugar/nucleoside kinase (ribokinase family)
MAAPVTPGPPGGRVLVVGDVINDIVVRPLGDFAVDSDTPALITQAPGGQGANQAAWLGWLGAAVSFVGRVGAADAAWHESQLQEHGVDAHLLPDVARATGTIVVISHQSGERSMLTDKGASAYLCETDLPPALLEGMSLLHVSGYTLMSDTSRPAVRRLFEASLADGREVTVDPSSVADLRRLGRREWLAATAEASVIFPNLDEGRWLAGRDSPPEVVSALLEHYPTVALTLGSEGALVASREAAPIHVPAVAAAVVDPTGAGDAFCAGFLRERLRGAGLVDTARAGAEAAAVCIGHVGGRPPASQETHRPAT